jgi:hypothetical protein
MGEPIAVYYRGRDPTVALSGSRRAIGDQRRHHALKDIEQSVGCDFGTRAGRGFFSKPPLWRIGLLLGVGLVLMAWAYRYGESCRPRELAHDVARDGIRKVREVIELVRKSDFGSSPRGRLLTAAAMDLMDQGRIRFSPNLEQEALYRKELGRKPVLYISVFCHKDRVLWPLPEELAERIYHEALHTVVQSKNKSREEECDAFCAAAEAAAGASGRLPRYPVMREGQTVWKWVQNAYSQYPSDRTYVPVGCTLDDLAVRTGITY